MKRIGEAHEALLLVLASDGVPNKMRVDGELEQVLGDFKQKCRDAEYQLKEAKPYTPWSNTAEDMIQELKKGTTCKMLDSIMPKCLWDDCAELKMLIWYHMAHNIFGLSGEVPETLITRSTAHRSEIADFKWDPISRKSWSTLLIAGTLRQHWASHGSKNTEEQWANGSLDSFQSLTQDKIEITNRINQRDKFNALIKIKSGDRAKPGDFEEDPGIQPQIFRPYEDDE
jgi:hypothetical protein